MMAAATTSVQLRDGRYELRQNWPEAIEAPTRVLLQAVQAALGKTPRVQATLADVERDRFMHLARSNRLLLLAMQGLDQRATPDSVRLEEQNYRAVTLQINAENLVTTRLVCEAMADAGIEAVVIKGPLAQHRLYADYFARPSMDVDILVARRRFEAASRVVESCGFVPALPSQRLWWRTFLGEQHFLSGRRGGVCVDLHHRTQQPGCPSPRNPARLLEQRVEIGVGGALVNVLSPPHACLLACMSIAKAMMQREPSGWHVADVAACVISQTAAEQRTLIEEATVLGLVPTLHLGLRAAAVLFGVQSPLADAGFGSDVLSVSQLVEAVLQPDSTSLRMPRRSRMLQLLSSGAPTFLRELVWKQVSEIAQKAASGPRV